MARFTVLLVGCGKMGKALVEGWLAQGFKPDDLTIAEPNQAGVPDNLRGRLVATAASLPPGFKADLVLLAVKPQSMDEVLPGLRRFADGGATFLSIAAGKTIAAMRRGLGEKALVVRSMPNTPAAVGRGITVAVAAPAVSAQARQQCGQLLQVVGEVLWVEDEALLDPVTAVSGSGPAYVFLLVEALAQAGVKSGLPADMAMALARATVSGSGELLRQSTEPAGQLRQNVTSPGGTTFAALQVLMAQDGLQPLMDKAIAAATKRSRELAG